MTHLPFRVNVVHCEPIAAHGLRAVLALQAGLSVLHLGEREAELNDSDVIVTDYEDALRRLGRDRNGPAHRGAQPRIVIVTMHAREEEVRRALAMGAIGFVGQDCEAEEFVEAVRSAAGRKRFLSRAVSASMAEGLAHASARLTQREMDVLELMVSGLCNKLIGTALEIAPTTAKSHVGAILEKLGARSRTEAAAIAARRGLVPNFRDLAMRHRAHPSSPQPPRSIRRQEQAALQ